jgi:hypothetical protein
VSFNYFTLQLNDLSRWRSKICCFKNVLRQQTCTATTGGGGTKNPRYGPVEAIIIFLPPIIKCRGALCHGLCIGVHKHLVSINYRTNAWVDWSDFSVAYWGWLEEGSFRWSPPPLIQDGRLARHLGFGLLWFSNQRLGRLVRFFSGSLGVTGGKFLSMTAHPTWPLRQPSWGFGFRRLSDKRLSTGPIFWCLIGVINVHHVLLLPTPTDNVPIMPRIALVYSDPPSIVICGRVPKMHSKTS